MTKTTKRRTTKAARPNERVKPPLTIKIIGAPGSGKTVVAALLMDAMQAVGWDPGTIITDEPKCFGKGTLRDDAAPKSFIGHGTKFVPPSRGWRPLPQTVRIESRGE